MRPAGTMVASAGFLLALAAAALFVARRGDPAQFGGFPAVLWLAGVAVLVAGAFLADRAGDETPAAGTPRWNARDAALLALVFLLALSLRFARLGSVPNGCQVDEAAHGLFGEAFTGGAPYVPYVSLYGGRTTLYPVLAGLTLKALGHGVHELRVTSAVLGSLTVLAFFLLARPLTGGLLAFATAALLAASRWHLTFSRIAFETILDPLATVVALLFLLRALRAGRMRDWALAGVAVAAGLNGYMAFRAAAVALFVFLAVELARRRRRSDARGVAFLLGGLLAGLVPLAVYAVQNPAVVVRRARLLSVWNDVRTAGGSLRPVAGNLVKTLGSLHVRGDANPVNNLPDAPLLDPVTGLLVLAGLVWAVRSLRRHDVARLVAIWTLAVGSLDVLSNTAEAPSARRILGLLPVLLLGAGLALRETGSALAPRARAVGAAALAAGLVFAGFFNVRRYFGPQAHDQAVWRAFSTDGSAPIGELLKSLPAGTAFYYSSTFPTDEVVDFVGQRRARAPLDLAARFPPAGDAVYVLPDAGLGAQLAALCSAGRLETHRDPWGDPVFVSFHADAETAASCSPALLANGLVARYGAGADPDGRASAVRHEALLYANDLLPAPFFITWRGALAAPVEGGYGFRLAADDGALLFLDGALVVDDGGSHALEAREAEATLTRGFHRIEIRYWQQGGARHFDVGWRPPGRTMASIPPRFLFPVEGPVPSGTRLPGLDPP